MPRLLALLSFLGLSGAAVAAEKWADPALKAPAGLVLWLDAGRQPAAWQAHGKSALRNGLPVDVCYDASGQALHLVQVTQGARPTYVEVDKHAALRFDGKDDWLGLAGLNRELGDFTLFVMAAPRKNAGGFRGFFAVNETGKNDYTTGMTVDQSFLPTPQFSAVNVEGRGFGGAQNLLKSGRPFGAFHTLEVRGTGRVIRLLVDGKAEGERERKEDKLWMANVVLGARCYSNTAEPPHVQGHLEGDVAEVLLFDRALGDADGKLVRDYLRRKYEGASEALGRPAEGVPLVRVGDPPAVQMLVPGFVARQLPIDLPNVNNVRYRPDGKLLALGYDGNLHLLSDSDGDGLEDRVAVFWEAKGSLQGPIGMALTPPGYEHGEGAFIAAKGKVVLVVDTDRDGKADRIITVAEGWKALPHGVDALGVAVDGEGSVYFGLGTADFTNAYLVDKDGKARYDLKGERGTIQKVSKDFKTRETVATGVRFSVGLAFNRRGDLFATDQEGATWLPNGNPFDELLHIQKGRHYGFPPRHPKHLPDVIDEPSVFDYSPQHQSTCGLCFNEPGKGGKVFGPAWWEGDALVCGYSRGKLYRTKLVRTEAGYVAQNNLIASLNALLVDACLSPKGELVVATHSGNPDWGTGPAGKGKLYKIAYKDGEPQPTLAWAAGPREVHVSFDRPLTRTSSMTFLYDQVKIEYGKSIRPGDRFEVHRPPYAVVEQDLGMPRYGLPVRGVSATPDFRTLILRTDPQTEAVPSAVTLPMRGPREKPGLKGELAQHLTIDNSFDLCGVQATWDANKESLKGNDHWVGWLPHLDFAVSRELFGPSLPPASPWIQGRDGWLTLTTQMDLTQMLRPTVQPGSTLDHTPPPETVTLVLRADRTVAVQASDPAKVKTSEKNDRFEARVEWKPEPGKLLHLRLGMKTTDKAPLLRVDYFTNEDPRERPMPLHRFLLPWASRQKPAAVARKRPPEIEGGSWVKGRALFASEEAQCAKCHSLRGQGGKIGPDLSNLIHRDYASVLRDVITPSAAIHPDHLTYLVELKNGRVLTGTVRSEGEKLIIAEAPGREEAVARDAVESMTASPVSTMPEGIDKVLGAEKLRDLMTYLLTEPLEPAPLLIEGAPAPRKRSEVEAVLKGAETPKELKPLRVLLAGGPKDHGPGEHDYPLFQRRWLELLSLAEGVHVHTAEGWPTPQQFEKADVIVFYSNNPGWSAERGQELDAFLERGGGLVYIHYAVDGHKADAALAERIGLAWRGGQSKFRHGALELDFNGSKHPVARNFNKVKFTDESYWRLTGDAKRVDVLATGTEDGEPQPLLWTREQGKGRVFVSIPGHYTWTFDDPLFRILLLRGLCWAGRQPVDRLNNLATLGARLDN